MFLRSERGHDNESRYRSEAAPNGGEGTNRFARFARMNEGGNEMTIEMPSRPNERVPYRERCCDEEGGLDGRKEGRSVGRP